jgi:O-phospho-L-seryl-tRNASec:L-selenocysteinyl-tRNA synthase
LDAIARSYPGRASASAAAQLFTSLLALGVQGYEALIATQATNRTHLGHLMDELAADLGGEVLGATNPVSCAISIPNLSEERWNKLPGMLYHLRVTGPRVVNPVVDPFGCCTPDDLPPYVVMNAAIGASRDHITGAVEKLRGCLRES